MSTLAAPGIAAGRAEISTARVPWFVWVNALAVSCASIGLHWDISWHRSIGRDSFWTPAHIAIYLCAVLAGVSCAWLILSATFGRSDAARACSGHMWGLYGPLGAFIALWGGAAMLTSAPFDDWWHGAYGLDVKVLSPPHVLLIGGMLTVQLGGLILILGAKNLAPGALRSRLDWIFLYIGGMMLTMALILVAFDTHRSTMHSSYFYLLIALAAPLVICGVAQASDKRWAATVVAAVYSAVPITLLWILPLFPAEPKLGPVWRQITHFAPPEFPLLLVAPAVAIDWVRPRIAGLSKWAQAAILGPVFLAVLWAVQWPFADFLMTPAARNSFFGAHYFGYSDHPRSRYARYEFFTEPSALFWARAAGSVICSFLMVRIGLAWGAWMRRVRR
ncbi:MAG: hypothetical protein ACRD8O_13390 [Bryobacteraceae bacterium]